MACACMGDADAALAELADDYVAQRYEHAPGKLPAPSHVSAVFARTLERRVGTRAAELLAHPRYRLHVFTSRGRHLLARGSRWRTTLGYAGAFVANAASRRALGLWLERVVFSDPRDALPLALADFRTHKAVLSAANLVPAVLASCSIPFWLDAVHDVPDAPRGAYWDGGITDYHLHLPYASMAEGLVLYPHFQPRIVPGWLDKPWPRRHAASPALDNVVVLSPSPAWVATLPHGKLPDRSDFVRFRDDAPARERAWRRALAESKRLVDEFEALAGGRGIEALPLP